MRLIIAFSKKTAIHRIFAAATALAERFAR